MCVYSLYIANIITRLVVAVIQLCSNMIKLIDSICQGSNQILTVHQTFDCDLWVRGFGANKFRDTTSASSSAQWQSRRGCYRLKVDRRWAITLMPGKRRIKTQFQNINDKQYSFTFANKEISYFEDYYVPNLNEYPCSAKRKINSFIQDFVQK